MVDSTARPGPGRTPGSSHRTPRWVVIWGMAAVLLALLFLAVHRAGGGLGGHAAPGARGHDGAHR